MSAHTPGPWIVSHDPDGSADDYCIGVPDGKVDQVAVCSKRDAPIISAAPDMYEALKATLRELTACANQLAHHGYRSPEGGSVHSAQQEARAALARASGQ